MSKYVVALVLAVCACGGNEPVQTQPDATPGPMCTKAVYDVCATNADCTRNDCHFYNDTNFSACTQPCTPMDDTTCPIDSTGNHAKCVRIGICKPAAANNCHL